MADIYISELNRNRVYRLPFIPEAMPQITVAAQNEEFESFENGAYNILGGAKLKELTLEGTLPNRVYSYAKSDDSGNEIIAMLENAVKRKRPLRLIISGSRRINMKVSVESLSYGDNKVGDTEYSVSFKEYRNV